MSNHLKHALMNFLHVPALLEPEHARKDEFLVIIAILLLAPFGNI